MKNKELTINGVRFEVCGECNALADYKGAVYDEIYSVYKKPSDAKVSIWHDWCDWCYRINEMHPDCNAFECGLHISSNTCMFFSIKGYVRMNDGTMYRLWITQAHNRAYKVTNI